MKIFLQFLVLVGLGVSFGCTKPAKITPNQTQKKIVVNAAFTYNDQIKLNVTSSKNIFENAPGLTDLEVNLFSHQFTEQAAIIYSRPIVLTNFYPDPSYDGYFHLSISAAGFDTIYTLAKIPKPINAFANFIDSLILYDQDVFEIDIDIIDDLSTDDYYMIDSRLKIFLKDGSIKTSTPWEVYTRDQRSDNRITTQTKYNNFRNIYLSDQKIQNSTNLISTIAYIESTLPENEDLSKVDTAIVELRVRRVEEDLYKHALNLDQYQEELQSGPDFEEQYISIHSNVSGGLGIFAGYSERSFEFQVYPK